MTHPIDFWITCGGTYTYLTVMRLAEVEARGLKPTLPAPYPAPYPAPKTALANRICWVAEQEPWGREFLVASYRAWFEDGLMAGSRENLEAALPPLGQDVDAMLALAEAPEVDAAVKANTDAARELGVFGAPTFSVGREIFWGDDRLEDAIAWAKGGAS